MSRADGLPPRSDDLGTPAPRSWRHCLYTSLAWRTQRDPALGRTFGQQRSQPPVSRHPPPISRSFVPVAVQASTAFALRTSQTAS
jgi:hypothetical protein